MASVQELIAAAEYQKKKSPFVQLAESALSGFQTGQHLKSAYLDNAIKAIQLDQFKQEAQRQEEMNKQIEEQLGLQKEKNIRDAHASLSTPDVATTPSARLQQEISQDEKGRYSRKFKVVEPKQVNYQRSEYKDAMGVKRVGAFDPTTGKTIQSPDDPPVGSDGISPSLEYQIQKDQEKKAMDIQELQIPGYKLTGEVRPTQKEAQDLRASVSRMGDFSKGIDQMIELIKKYGSTNTFGEGSGDAESLASNLKLTLKDVAKLGVLSASDLALVEGQITDPSSLRSMGTSTKNALAKLERAKARADQLVESELRTRGFMKTYDNKNSASEDNGIGWSDAEEQELQRLEKRFGGSK